ncbi:MAG: hypothetical protein RBT65_12995 [Methanolobus sp.]|nr:hypothetical protein [Methanolobus sp.]
MKEPLKIVNIALGVLLLLAILPFPYGYYTFLRLAVFIGGSFLAYQLYLRESVGWAVVLACMAILFNPLIPVYLTREIWLPIDLLCAGLLFYTSFTLKGVKNE